MERGELIYSHHVLAEDLGQYIDKKVWECCADDVVDTHRAYCFLLVMAFSKLYGNAFNQALFMAIAMGKYHGEKHRAAS